MQERSRLRSAIDVLVRSIVPLLLALVVGGIVIAALGIDPFAFYGGVIQYGLLGENWMRSLTQLVPLLIMAVGLIVAFRGKLWNLGYDGLYLLGAVVVSGLGPMLFDVMPVGVATILLFLGALVVGAIWSLIPAFLKARYGTNEIITSLVMSFIGVGIANLLISGIFNDPDTATSQTRVIDDDALLPFIPGTEVHYGLVLAIVLAVAFHLLLTRTSFGLRLDVYGASPKAARHVGISSGWMVVVLFVISGALVALSGAVDILGEWRYQRTNWNPAYGNAVLPFVFLARLNPIGAIPLLAFYAVLATGGRFAAQQSGLSIDFLMIIVAMILVFMTITEYFATRSSKGLGYVPDGLKRTVLEPFSRKGGRA